MAIHEDKTRVERWKQLRHEQFYEKRLVIIRLPKWLAALRRTLTGGYGPEKWRQSNDH